MMTDESATVRVDFTRTVGGMKPMHGVGQPPCLGWNYELFHYLTEAGIPFSRLHDMGGHHGANSYVDIPNLFRDFDADEANPENYDFELTDRLLSALVGSGVEPFFRLGVSIENTIAFSKPVRTYPPKDFAKWARICEHVIRHYTEGWANGFRYPIRYWEIWNEPENFPEVEKNQMWTGTWAQYKELYAVTATHLKQCFPHLKIGGYGSCGFYAAVDSAVVSAANSSPRMQYFVECYRDFLTFVKENEIPLDFFSFHTYSGVRDALRQIDWGIKTLHEFGFEGVETTLNEWLVGPSHERLGTAEQASEICAMLIGMQRSKLDSAMIYDGRCGIGNYSPLFNPMTYQPHKAYYALKAFNEAYRLQTEVLSECSHEDVFVLAAGDSQEGVVLVANIGEKTLPVKLDCGGRRVVGCRVTDASHTDEAIPFAGVLSPNSFVLLRVVE